MIGPIFTAISAALLVSACINQPAPHVSTGCHDQHPAWDRAELHLMPVFAVTVDEQQRLTFDGKPMDDETLASLLNEARWSDPLSPEVIFKRGRNLPCDQVARVRQLLESTLACRDGRCAEVQPPPR